jgi:Flp pilus assembly protein TadG
MIKRYRVRNELEISVASFVRSFLKMMRCSDRATLALEFAFVAPVFLFCLCYLMDTAFEIWSKAALDAALDGAARQVELGLVTNVTDFKTFVCQEVGTLVALGQPSTTCSSILQVYATTATTNSGLVATSIVGNALSSTAYNTGGDGSMVFIEVGYPRLFMFPMSSVAAGGSSQMVVSRINFQNEPF